MKIFISYSRESEAAVQRLAEDFKALGHESWIDTELSGGQEWWDAILRHIRECDVFVAAISPRALASTACKRETAYAADVRKPVLPVLVSPDVSSDVLTPALSRLQFVDYRIPSNRDTALRLARAVATLPTPTPQPVPLPTPPEAPISRLTELRRQVESAADMPYPEQTALLLELSQALRDPEQAKGARTILGLFQARGDLRLQVAEEIKRVLAESPAPITSASVNRWSRRQAVASSAVVAALLAIISIGWTAWSDSKSVLDVPTTTESSNRPPENGEPPSSTVVTPTVPAEEPPAPRPEPTDEDVKAAAAEHTKAMAAKRDGSLQEAETYLLKAITLNPSHLDAARLRCEIGVELERSYAVKACEDAIALRDDDSTYYRLLALALRPHGGPAPCDAVNKALTINPKDGEAYYLRGLCGQYDRLWAAALTDFQDAYRYVPSHWRARYGASLALYRQGRLVDAEAEASRGIALNPKSPHLFDLRAIVRWRMEKKDAARADVKTAMNLAPGDGAFSRELADFEEPHPEPAK